MALQVTLLKTPEKISESGTDQTFHTFDSQGGTLGRSESNTWTLPDPDRFLSSCHCEILFADNQYYLVDLSTNGTFVRGSPEPLGKGVKAPLGDGDTFEIGDYQFSVKSTAAQPESSSSPFAPLASGGSTIDDMVGGAGGSPFADPFGHSAPLSDDLSLSPDIENTDPLLALDMVVHSPGSEGDSGMLFGGGPESGMDHDAYAGMGQVDQSPGMDESVSWPDSAQENLIPDDWEDDLLGSAQASGPAPLPDEPVAAVMQSRQELARQEMQAEAVSRPQPSTVQAPQNPAYQLESDELDPREPQPLASRQSAPQRPAPPDMAPGPDPQDSPLQAREIRDRDVQNRPRHKATAALASGQSDRRFIAAMGLDPDSLSDDQVNEISEMSGELMREIVDGMMQVLRSRTSIKNEFRMNVTTIEPFKNNPLKFSVGVDEALENMFIKNTKAYKKPIEAFREGFQEIGEHQLAMIAGIRLGFERMMERFDPEILENNFNKQGKGSAIPGMQKAKYWTAYSDYYSGFSDNMESSFQHLFGSDFVHAYEDQLRKLTASRKKKK